MGVLSSSSASAAAAAALTETALGCFYGWKWFLWCGMKFFSMKINVGMTPTIIPKVLFWDMILELKIVYGNVNNGHRNATIITRGITSAFKWYY